MFTIATSETASVRRVRRIAVQPFDDAAGEGADLGLAARQFAVGLGDAGPLVEEDLPILDAPLGRRGLPSGRAILGSRPRPRGRTSDRRRIRLHAKAAKAAKVRCRLRRFRGIGGFSSTGTLPERVRVEFMEDAHAAFPTTSHTCCRRAPPTSAPPSTRSSQPWSSRMLTASCAVSPRIALGPRL